MYTIDVYGPKGGVGKTTLSVNVAACLATQGYSVALVDLDKQRSAMDVFDGEAMNVKQLTRTPNDGFDYVIVDHVPSHDRVPKGDLVIMPTLPNVIDITSSRKAAKNVGTRPLILVCNRVDARKESHRLRWLEMRNNYDAFKVNQRSIYEKAAEKGVSVFQMGSAYAARDARKEILNIVESAKHTLVRNEVANG